MDRMEDIDNDRKIRYNRTPNTEHDSTFSLQNLNERTPQFSIILIVYNCEKYIVNCLDSLTKQNCEPGIYEVIITDDGSTDKSGAICDTYAEKFPFVHVTHTDNFGESHARNTGLQKCTGRYIIFCDGDDVVSPHLISVLSEAVKINNEPDIITYGSFTELSEEVRPVYDVHDMKPSKAEWSDAETLSIMCAGRAGGYIWNKAFKSEIALSVKFDETVKASEDSFWLMCVLSMNNNIRVCCINNRLYHYIQHPNFGQTRNLRRIYDEHGMRRSILSYLKSISLPELSPGAKQQFRGKIYSQSVQSIWMNQVDFSNDVYARFKSFMKDYAVDYYTSYQASFYAKMKIFVKHILVLLHIHKPRRK